MKILILEDDTILRKAIAFSFSDTAHRVFAAANGTEALEIVSDNRDIDLIITDVMVPEVSGPSVILTLKKYLGRHVPKIIVISGITDGEEFIRKLDIPHDYFLPKPIDFAQLKTLVEEINLNR